MTNILSTISGQFTKALILGAFFPSLLFVMLWILLLAPLFPAGAHLFLPLASLDKEWRVLAVSLVTLVVTGLVYNLNSPITRIYEGYPWQRSFIGKKRAARHRRRFVAAKAQRARLRYLCDYLEGVSPASQKISAGRARQSSLARIVNNEFPNAADLILPTRLGNIIRSFEQYPFLQYGMSAIIFWPRLVAKIDERYSQSLDGAKASFDFMINASALSAVSTLGLLFVGVLSDTPLGLNLFTLSWLSRVAFFLLASWLTYEGAIVQARNWGSQVKGAFDLYRFDLLKQLGYQHAPENRAEEKYLWKAITQKTAFPDLPREPQPGYAPGDTRVMAAAPEWACVRVLRSVSPQPAGVVSVLLEIQNLEKHREAKHVLVLDTLSAEAEFLTSSCSCTGATGTLLSTRPFSYRLETLAASQTATIKYQIVMLGKPSDTSACGVQP